MTAVLALRCPAIIEVYTLPHQQRSLDRELRKRKGIEDACLSTFSKKARVTGEVPQGPGLEATAIPGICK